MKAVTPVDIEVSLSTASGRDVTADYAVTGGTATGGDYTLAAGTVTILAGATTANVSLAVTNDTTYEANETVEITLSNPTNATLGANTLYTYTIQDNDTAPTIAFTGTNSAGAEDASPVSIEVSL